MDGPDLSLIAVYINLISHHTKECGLGVEMNKITEKISGGFKEDGVKH